MNPGELDNTHFDSGTQAFSAYRGLLNTLVITGVIKQSVFINAMPYIATYSYRVTITEYGNKRDS